MLTILEQLFLTAFGVVLFVCLDFGFGKHIIAATNYRGLVVVRIPNQSHPTVSEAGSRH